MMLLTLPPKRKVAEIGGLFFRSRNPDVLAGWYHENLGVAILRKTTMRCRGSRKLVHRGLSSFPYDTDYFGDAKQQWMVNFRVRNLDAMMTQLRAAGIKVDLDPNNYPKGRFARLYDPEGNPVELWEPAGRDAPR